jgi:hypothetical protein
MRARLYRFEIPDFRQGDRHSIDGRRRFQLQPSLCGARSLLRAPLFSLTVVALLALGIGANTAISSLMREALLLFRAVYSNVRDHNAVSNFAASRFLPFQLAAVAPSG